MISICLIHIYYLLQFPEQCLAISCIFEGRVPIQNSDCSLQKCIYSSFWSFVICSPISYLKRIHVFPTPESPMRSSWKDDDVNPALLFESLTTEKRADKNMAPLLRELLKPMLFVKTYLLGCWITCSTQILSCMIILLWRGGHRFSSPWRRCPPPPLTQSSEKWIKNIRRKFFLRGKPFTQSSEMWINSKEKVLKNKGENLLPNCLKCGSTILGKVFLLRGESSDNATDNLAPNQGGNFSRMGSLAKGWHGKTFEHLDFYRETGFTLILIGSRLLYSGSCPAIWHQSIQYDAS